MPQALPTLITTPSAETVTNEFVLTSAGADHHATLAVKNEPVLRICAKYKGARETRSLSIYSTRYRTPSQSSVTMITTSRLSAFSLLAVLSSTRAAIGPVTDLVIANKDIAPDGYNRSSVPSHSFFGGFEY